MCIFKWEGPHKNLGTERKQQQGSVWAHLGNVWCTMMHFCVMVPHGSFGACLDPAVTQANVSANVSLKGRTKEERLSKLRQNYDPKQWIQGNQSAMFECPIGLARLARWTAYGRCWNNGALVLVLNDGHRVGISLGLPDVTFLCVQLTLEFGYIWIS